MCVMSMIADHYREKWTQPQPVFVPWTALDFTNPFVGNIPAVTRVEFDKLRADVDEMIALLKRAKIYDAATNQPDCETDAKMAVLRKVAELVGVDLDKAIHQG